MKLGLVANAKNLKNHPDFSCVYINRDLTYKQREEAKARRAARKKGEIHRPPLSSANSVPVNSTGTTTRVSTSTTNLSAAAFIPSTSSARGGGGRGRGTFH